ncbi:twin-arginine translocation signal domain-containing protein [Streptomyces sp. WMMB303]|uniref:twin-arginine translocation signal domain-containing protein n=1 Tax=Streptomyces sp. WMMB303 TaxID=3034154 RepID=UPI0023EBB0C8|nr:twin-arginine translocation signal domain-containing protein [Streptomyces sp. WMMB303]MDF4249971.1 twin-arginine translocation signal domain-containing protein [Streptomyces sp. WMMB303]
MRNWNRRRFITAAGGAAGAALAAGAAPAHAAPRAQQAEACAPLRIVTGEEDFVCPSTAPPGASVFRVTATSFKTGFLGLVRLRDGHEEGAFRELLYALFSARTPQETIEATRGLMDTAELYGGAAVHPGAVSYITPVLEPGSYLVLEYRDFQGPLGREPERGQEHVRTLTVTEPVTGTAAAAATGSAATLTTRETAEGPRFELHGQPGAGSPVRCVNQVTQPDEAIIYRVPDDSVTEEDVHAFFNSDMSMTPPFSIEAPLGTPPISPGGDLWVTMPTEPGRYVAASWVGSLEDGRPMAAHGQHLIFHVTA